MSSTSSLICGTDRPTLNTIPYRLYEQLPRHMSRLHLLVPPFHPNPRLPVVCLADRKETLMPLLCAALQQRQALGFDYSVVGILMPSAASEESLHCDIYIGWVDWVDGAVSSVSCDPLRLSNDLTNVHRGPLSSRIICMLLVLEKRSRAPLDGLTSRIRPPC